MTQDTDTTAPPLDQLATALVKAQAAMAPAVKDSVNPHFGSRYADLAAVWEAARGPLTSHGLSVVQLPGRTDGLVTVTTVLLHTSGQSISSTVGARPSRDDAQGLGSVLTYLRRYALAAMVGIVQDDDDGNAASARRDDAPNARPHRTAPRADAKPTHAEPTTVTMHGKAVQTAGVTRAQLTELGALVKQLDAQQGAGTAKALLPDGVTSTVELTAEAAVAFAAAVRAALDPAGGAP